MRVAERNLEDKVIDTVKGQQVGSRNTVNSTTGHPGRLESPEKSSSWDQLCCPDAVEGVEKRPSSLNSSDSSCSLLCEGKCSYPDSFNVVEAYVASSSWRPTFKIKGQKLYVVLQTRNQNLVQSLIHSLLLLNITKKSNKIACFLQISCKCISLIYYLPIYSLHT